VTVRPATTYPVLLGRVVKRLRERADHDQATLATVAKVTQPTWSRLERGVTPVNVETLALVCPVLQTSLGALLTLTDRAAAAAKVDGIEVCPSRAVPKDCVTISTQAVALLVEAVLPPPPPPKL